MAWQLVYYSSVATDVKEAKKWYFERQKGLEKRFAQDVKQCIGRLKKHPLIFEIRYKQVRLAHCEIFPYSVHYYIDEVEKQLVIIGIVHQHRDPQFAKKR